MTNQTNPKLKTVLARADTYAAARRNLEEVVEEISEGRKEVMRKHRRLLEARSARAVDAKASLDDAVKDSPELFRKPKSQTHIGIRFGFRKKKGKIVVDDDAYTIGVLRKKLKDGAEKFIKRTESLKTGDLAELPSKVLMAAGVTVIDDTDEHFVTVPKDDVAKIVDALLKEGEADEQD